MNYCMRSRWRLFPLGCLWLFALPSITAGQEWTRFRGPNGSGVSQATSVPVQWTEQDYNWKVKLPGKGHSSPVLWGEQLFITSGNEETAARIVLCLNAEDGRLLWQREFVAPRHDKHALNSFASSTPTVDAGQVYVCWATPQEFVVMALDHDGKDRWRTELGPFQASHGFGASPIVYEDLVIVPNDQDGSSSLVALERSSGKIRWTVPRRGQASYSTPCVYRPAGRPAELIFTNWHHGITGIDPASGKVNWEADLFDQGHVESAIASPVLAGPLVIGTCGWLGQKKEVVAFDPASFAARSEPKAVYRIDRSAPLVTTPLIHDGLLFLWSDEGIVTCADATSGEVFWRRRAGGEYYSSPICVGDHLYGVSVDGKVVVLAAAKQYALLARNPLGEGSHSTPAVARGTMFLRTFSQLIAIGGEETGAHDQRRRRDSTLRRTPRKRSLTAR